MNAYLIGMLISLAAYVIIGFLISRKVKTSNDYYVAGRKAPTALIVGSLVASYCSTNYFMADAGEIYSGLFFAEFLCGIILSGGYILGAVFFGRFLRRSEALTIPEFLGRRFHSKAVQKLAAVTEIVSMAVYLLSVIQAIGILMSAVTGLEYHTSILIALLVFTVLTVSSGANGVLITDTIMFGFFTLAMVISLLVIVQKAGGWAETVGKVTAVNSSLLSWHGDLSYFYPTGAQNMVWTLSFSLVWTGVCMVAPWQTSRYLMAKNEHTVIRSSVYAFGFVLLLTLFLCFGSVFIHAFRPELESASHVWLWAAMNILPTVLGVILLTGLLAAGISSATTFLSLIGASMANDLFEIGDDQKRIRVGRISIVVAAAVILAVSRLDSPMVFVIMNLSTNVITAAWLPVCLAAVWSKRVTKTGAFWGMLIGFVSSGVVKIIASFSDNLLPPYFDAFYIGVILNILAIVIGSALTKPAREELEAYHALHIMPQSELVPAEIRKTRFSLKLYFVFCAAIVALMIVLWVIPYWKALG